MKKKQLTKEEIAQLKGGWRDYPPLGYEVKNINNAFMCICEYDNKPSVINKNRAEGCGCTCSY